jgi:predicted alpha/beta hydrolase family esterase
MFSAEFAKITESIILVGHSLGGSVLLKYLSEEHPAISISGLFLVATPHWKGNMKEFELKQNFQTSIKSVTAIFLYHSKNDPEVPFEDLKFYKEALDSAIVRELQVTATLLPKVFLNSFQIYG